MLLIGADMFCSDSEDIGGNPLTLHSRNLLYNPISAAGL